MTSLMDVIYGEFLHESTQSHARNNAANFEILTPSGNAVFKTRH